MFFEGSEKKLEVVVKPEAGSLRQKDESFWKQLVQASRAQILSKISSESCDAYLLSESSLFVWDDHFTMITCGQTTLVDGALFFLKQYKASQLLSFIYERKNEYFPHLQHTHFFQDIERLREALKGKAFRFGNADEHHLFMFHADQAYQPELHDTTLELLMYDLQGEVFESFRSKNQESDEIRRRTEINKILPGFQIDDYVFQPCGYSLNALKGAEYYTLHVTPQELSCYVSFETNVFYSEGYRDLVLKIIEVFRPKSFDVVTFQPSYCQSMEVPGFERRSLVEEELSCGYGVVYSHFFQPAQAAKKAYFLKEV